MTWKPNLDLVEVRFGFKHRTVPLLKRRLIAKLVRKGTKYEAKDKRLVRWLFPRSRFFNKYTRTAVRVFQWRNGLTVDGVVGRQTWLALGFSESDLMPTQVNGIPYPGSGVRPLDGRWVALPLWTKLAKARMSGWWQGVCYSGWRPNWYQKILWDAAVRKYGSEAAASKWVARPGTSNHRHRDNRGAVDVTYAHQLLNHSSLGFFRPMSWEEWHLQIAAAWGRSMRAVRSLLGITDEREVEDFPVADATDEAMDPPEGIDMDMVLAYVEDDLNECEMRETGE